MMRSDPLFTVVERRGSRNPRWVELRLSPSRVGEWEELHRFVAELGGAIRVEVWAPHRGLARSILLLWMAQRGLDCVPVDWVGG